MQRTLFCVRDRLLATERHLLQFCMNDEGVFAVDKCMTNYIYVYTFIFNFDITETASIVLCYILEI